MQIKTTKNMTTICTFDERKAIRKKNTFFLKSFDTEPLPSEAEKTISGRQRCRGKNRGKLKIILRRLFSSN